MQEYESVLQQYFEFQLKNEFEKLMFISIIISPQISKLHGNHNENTIIIYLNISCYLTGMRTYLHANSRKRCQYHCILCRD